MMKGNAGRVLSVVVFITQLTGILSFDYRHVKEWSATYKECGGRRQSPINIVTRKIKKELKENLKMSGGEIKPTRIEVKNEGHTERPSIRGGPLNGVYVFDSFHFHWSNASVKGSEHTINGK
ncbi:carbonic anhydrase 6-like isoform X2 [Belonocnema kinseyi]|uniref:carbonic anhydrase 6-like isoform X2 n=1 Tax=Belonocnema kinseyi TaxID=2817044 RepID=UPI00143D7ECA|nr:carbonic anhydrase 6-like isoform X2 [Belonocnema kinseyi]